MATVATEEPEKAWTEFGELFKRLGVGEVARLDVAKREDALQEDVAAILNDARGVFFTGGDQLRITSLLGDSPCFLRIQRIHDRGGIIAGTSARAPR